MPISASPDQHRSFPLAPHQRSGRRRQNISTARGDLRTRCRSHVMRHYLIHAKLGAHSGPTSQQTIPIGIHKPFLAPVEQQSEDRVFSRVNLTTKLDLISISRSLRPLDPFDSLATNEPVDTGR